MNDRYMKLKDAIDVVRNTVAEGKLESTLELRLLDKSLTADVRDDATAHKVLGGGERDGATCWFECDNCGSAVDIGDVFCKHCGARFVP